MKFTKITFIILTLIIFSQINIAIGQYRHLKLDQDIQTQLKKKKPCINSDFQNVKLNVVNHKKQTLITKTIVANKPDPKTKEVKKDKTKESTKEKKDENKKVEKNQVKKQKITQPFKRKLINRKRKNISKLRKAYRKNKYRKMSYYKVKRFKTIRYYGLPVPKHELECKPKVKSSKDWIFKKDTYTAKKDQKKEDCKTFENTQKTQEYKTYCKLVKEKSSMAWIFTPDTDTKINCSVNLL